eukprot:scaffold56983_cov70-Phaeocystis_antarctica.AAC.1
MRGWQQVFQESIPMLSLVCTGLVGLSSGVGLGVFSRASFAIQPRPRLRTILDGAGPQAPGVHGICKSNQQKLYTFRPRTLRNVVGRRARAAPCTPAMRPQWPYYSVRRSSAHHLASSRGKFLLLQPLNSPVQCLLASRWAA